MIEQGPIEVSVRNVAGQSWKEHWSKGKLAYFILMCDLEPPKFERALEVEWVPFDTNEYSWPRPALSRSEFNSIRSAWPQSEPRVFDPEACDRVNLVCETSSMLMGVGFNPRKREPGLFERLVALGGTRIRYVEFDYGHARDVYTMSLDQSDRNRLLAEKRAVESIERVSSGLSSRLRSPELIEANVKFLCRRGSFEVPISIYYGT